MWQVVGECIHNDRTPPHEVQTNSSPLENDSSSPLHSSWIQSVLMTALEKEPPSRTISHCCHLLLYLHSLKVKLTTVCNSSEERRLQAAILLCFQLLQYLLQRLVSIQQDVNKDKTRLPEEINSERLSTTVSSAHGTSEQGVEGICLVEDMCRTVLHHPVVLNCFLWKAENSLSHDIPQDVGAQLTYNVSNLLLAVLPSLQVQQRNMLMDPFIRKLGDAGRIEIQAAEEGNGRRLFFKDLFLE